MDFEFSVDYETSFSAWYPNGARGKVGELPIGNNDSIKMLWEVGYAGEAQQQITHCHFDNSSCYKVKAVPVIFNISSNTGYTSGGQNLTIYGHGFNNDNISVTVDGANCKVSYYRDDSVSCEIQSRSSPSVSGVPQLGGHGVKSRFVNKTYSLNIDRIQQDYYSYKESLRLNFEVPRNIDDNIGHKLIGWFIAPSTTRYRFYQTSNDYSRFLMGLNTSNPLDTTLLTYRKLWAPYRNFFRMQLNGGSYDK